METFYEKKQEMDLGSNETKDQEKAHWMSVYNLYKSLSDEEKEEFKKLLSRPENEN